jgi:hypothetical protein
MKTKKLGICESMIPSALFISAVYPVYSIPTIPIPYTLYTILTCFLVLPSIPAMGDSVYAESCILLPSGYFFLSASR